jgi:hypothetical protein
MMNVGKKLRSESGAAAVEFALLLPVLMLILFGIIEFGLALHQQAILTNASREGARLGIVSCDLTSPNCPPDVNAKIDTYLIGAGINPANVLRTPAPTLTGGTGSAVIVTLTLPYTPITSFIAPISLVARTEMRHE